LLEYQVYIDTVGDPEKYRVKLSEILPSIKFVVAKKAESLYSVVTGASIVAKISYRSLLPEWLLDETHKDISRNFGSGYSADPNTKAWLKQHKHGAFGFPTVVRFS
ncbi:Ribonuclease H2 subunit A, partial [Linum perenne]